MKKRKRKKLLKKIVLLLIVATLIYIGYKKVFNTSKQETSKIDMILKEKNIDKSNYSATLEYVLLNNIYNETYLNEYKDITFNNQSNFTEIITTFLPLGYSGKEINYLFLLSSKNIEYLKNNKYMDIKDYYKLKNFDASKLERYNTFKKNNNYDLKDIVTYVNINLDKPAYTETVISSNPDSLTVLVNKYNGITETYKPKDLVYVDGAYGNKVPMRSVIKESFVELQQAAKKEININLLPTTAFRDGAFQKTLYNNYVAKDGVAKADKYSARPGYSEHQTGLAIDLKNTALNNTRLTDDNYKWLEDNSYKYGFIIRFPKDKEFITGYQFENWHIRYVGEKIAKIIHDNDLTLEEYIDLYETEY